MIEAGSHDRGLEREGEASRQSTDVSPRNTKMVFLATVASLAKRITVNPQQCGGQPCVRGMRIRVADVLDLLAAGLSPAQVLKEFPDLEPEDIKACLRYASQRLSHPVLAA